MALTTKDAAGNDVTYMMYRLDANRATYIGPEYTDYQADTIVLSSVAPRRVGSQLGNRRTTQNCIYTVDAPTAVVDELVKKDMKLELLASIPSGATLAQFQELIARQVGLLEDDTYVTQLFLHGQIDHH